MEERVRIPWEDWKLVKSLGKGGFGEVWEIERVKHGITEKAAMKVISIPQGDDEIECLQIEGYTDESITQRFSGFVDDVVREYGMMVQMKGNANIVYCDDYKSIQHDDGFGWDIYIKMELLIPMMKDLKLVTTEPQIIQFAKDICCALIVCQKRNVIHRDIKPQNIFVSEDGVFKLGDFGIARAAERTTRATVGVGTYQFMAPEVKNDQPYGATADIYSLGLVLHWLLNERRSPFLPLPPEAPRYGDEERAKQRRFSGEAIPAPKNGSEEIKRIVLKACAFDPKQRYQSAAELLSDLTALQGELVHVAIPEQDMDVPQETVDVIPNTDEGKTVGPVFRKKGPETQLDEEQTVGPKFDKIAQEEQLDNEKTVGPVFAPKDKPKQSEKKKKVWSVIAVLVALFIAVALGSVFALSRAVVVGITPSQADLEKYLLDGYSAIGCYEVSTRIPVESRIEVNFEVGEAYSGCDVLITVEYDTMKFGSDNGLISATVIEGKVSANLYPTGTYIVQVATDATNEANWSEWDTELPEGVLLNSDTVQVDIMYRARQKEFATSNRETMDGWELYDTFIPDAPYGEWSDWTETVLTGDEYLEVEEQKQYRYREKETTTSDTTASMDGWISNGSKANYSYGSWSSWSIYGYWYEGSGRTYMNSLDSSTSEIQQREAYHYNCYRYKDGELTSTDTYTMGAFEGTPSLSKGDVYSIEGDETYIVTSISCYTQYRYRTKTYTSTTYYFYRWTDWSEWSIEPVEETDTIEVEEKSIYRIRDIYGEVGYRFWKWSDWSDCVLEKQIDGEDTEVECCMVYRYVQ